MTLKNTIESHPILAIIGAASLILNFTTIFYGLYSTQFGERPIISENYIFSPLANAEDYILSGRNSAYNCTVLHNKVREIYQPTDKKHQKDKNPLNMRHLEGFYIVIKNTGSSLAKDMILQQTYMPKPIVSELIPAFGKDGEFLNKRPPNIYELINEDGSEIKDSDATIENIRVGDLLPGACLAIPLAIVDRSEHSSGAMTMTSDPTVGPIYKIIKIKYKRPFGLFFNEITPRTLNSTPIQIERKGFILG